MVTAIAAETVNVRATLCRAHSKTGVISTLCLILVACGGGGNPLGVGQGVSGQGVSSGQGQGVRVIDWTRKVNVKTEIYNSLLQQDPSGSRWFTNPTLDKMLGL